MPIRVDRLHSDVRVEPERAPHDDDRAVEPDAVDERARHRALAESLRRAAARTAAEDFDD